MRAIALALRGSRLRAIALALRGSRLRAIALALRGSRLRAIALALRGSRLRAIALALRGSRLRAIALALRVTKTYGFCVPAYCHSTFPLVTSSADICCGDVYTVIVPLKYVASDRGLTDAYSHRFAPRGSRP